MRVACVITGLPRNVQEGYDHFWKHIIEKYNADVYSHHWQTDDYHLVHPIYANCLQRSIYSEPASFKRYQTDIEAVDNSSRYDERFEVGGYFRGLPMYLGWQTASFLLMYEILFHGAEYDMIVRGRFDLYNPDINLDKIDLDMINISAFNWPGSAICDDNLMVCNQQNFLNLHSNIFNDVINYTKEHKRIHFQEKMLTEMIAYKGLTPLVYKSHQLRFHFVRDVIKQQL